MPFLLLFYLCLCICECIIHAHVFNFQIYFVMWAHMWAITIKKSDPCSFASKNSHSQNCKENFYSTQTYWTQLFNTSKGNSFTTKHVSSKIMTHKILNRYGTNFRISEKSSRKERRRRKMNRAIWISILWFM